MKNLKFWVGSFVLAGFAAILFLAFEVANITGFQGKKTYELIANFDNIGNLKLRSPVKIGGVVIGSVSSIVLDPQTHRPKVTMQIAEEAGYFSENSRASILTAGLIGEQYIGITPGFSYEDEEPLKDGMRIEETKSALVLEDLIGQFLYSMAGSKE